VFSGAASACCAPVLAGVLTLSAVSPGLAAGIGIGMAYVFGMVFPLVILTLLWDRLGPDQVQFGSRQLSFGIGRVRVATTAAGLAAAAMFLVMAAVLAVVAVTGSSLAPSFTASLGIGIEGVLTPVLDSLAWVPDPVMGVLLIAVAAAAIALSTRRQQGDLENDEQDERSCHDQDHSAATS
jgi:hypothetical protein